MDREVIAKTKDVEIIRHPEGGYVVNYPGGSSFHSPGRFLSAWSQYYDKAGFKDAGALPEVTC